MNKPLHPEVRAFCIGFTVGAAQRLDRSDRFPASMSWELFGESVRLVNTRASGARMRVSMRAFAPLGKVRLEGFRPQESDACIVRWLSLAGEIDPDAVQAIEDLIWAATTSKGGAA